MADEFARIQNISVEDEGQLRQDVAARVAAQSSAEGVADEQELAKAWGVFQRAERRVRELQQSVELLEREIAQRANGVPLDHATEPASTIVKKEEEHKPAVAAPQATTATAATTNMTAKALEKHLGDQRFKLRAASRDLAQQQVALGKTQTDVEARRRRRLEEAKQRAAEEERKEDDGQTSNSNSGNARVVSRIAASARRLQRDASGATEERPASSPSPASLMRALPRPPGAVAVPLHRGIPAGGAVAAIATAASSPLPSRVPSSFPLDARHAITRLAYTGGEVLPSLSRVHVTRADLKARQLRYNDDSDMDAYLARQRKRRRLEMVEALQRHRLASAPLSSPASRSSSSSSSGAQQTPPPRRPRVKREEKSTHESPSAAVKAEAESGARAAGVATAPTKATAARGVTLEELTAVSQGRARDGAEVIDVDQMMEEEDDVSIAFVRSVLKAESSSRAGSEAPSSTAPGRGKNRTAPAAKSKGKRARRGARIVNKNDDGGGGDSSSSSSGEPSEADEAVAEAEIERAFAALQLPPEPVVTLLPGITIDAAVYERLLDYQQEGLRWLVHLHAQRSGGVLGDEMGLGKTVQVAALLNALHRSQQLLGPVLIVAPMTVLQQWVAELHRWVPKLRVCVMHEGTTHTGGGSSNASAGVTRTALLESVRGTAAVVITTYAAMRLKCLELQNGGFHYLILDEGHKISNPDAAVTLAAKSFPTPHRLILSGSPVQNRLKELWSLFDFVKPGLLGALHRFTEEFETPIGMSKNVRATPLALATAVECAKVLQSQLAPYLLRRLKKQVNTVLPKKYERVIRSPLSDEQLELYVELVASAPVQELIGNTLYQPQIHGGGLNRDGRDSTGCLHVAGRRVNLMSNHSKNFTAGIRLAAFRVMNQLRQICNHADLFRVVRGEDDDYLDEGGGGGGGRRRRAAAASSRHYRSFRSNNPVNLAGSGKLRVLLDMLREWKLHHHRALLFTQTRMMLDIIENLCEQENYRYIRMDGTTPASHRQELMDRFNEDGSVFLALLTTRVGGIGVNLTGADRVVIYDPDWNPVTDVQARERAWRIGQTRDVCVYRLITSGTVEEAILRRQLAKTYVTEKVLKDPNLQRFFHQQENLVESFFLGAEYDQRVAASRKHVLAAQEMATLPFADDAGGEQELQMEHDDVNSPRGPADGTADSAGEREFGRLLRVSVQEAEDDGLDNSVDDDEDEDDGEGVGSRPASPRRAAADSETALLRNLLNGHGVTLTGGDRAAQRLAAAKARQTMQRVVARPERSLAVQHEEFSLVLAAQRRDAAEAAARAEQGVLYASTVKDEEEEQKKRVRQRLGW